MEMSAVIVSSSPDYMFATWRQMMIAVWHGETTLEGVKLADGIYEDFAAKNPGGIFVLTIVEEHAPMPDSATRAALSHQLKSGGGKTKYSAVVHEGTGFRAAAVRSVVTGITLFSKPPYPHKVFATVLQAANFFAEARPAFTVKDVTSAVADARTRYVAMLQQQTRATG